MTNQHPITPPPDLVQQWIMEATEPSYVPTQAARWGADQELEACCEWMLANARFLDAGWIERLRASRRSKPQSLKEQALQAARIELVEGGKNAALILRALEALPDAD